MASDGVAAACTPPEQAEQGGRWRGPLLALGPLDPRDLAMCRSTCRDWCPLSWAGILAHVGGPDRDARLAALLAVARVGPAALMVVARLATCLSDTDPKVRLAALKALRSALRAAFAACLAQPQLGVFRPVPEVRALLDPVSIELAMAAAAHLAANDSAAHPVATELCANLMLFVGAGHPEAIVVHLGDPCWGMRAFVLGALRTRGAEGAEHSKAVAACLADANLCVRWSALQALAVMGEAAIAHAADVAACLADPCPSVRSAACEALAGMGPAAAEHRAAVAAVLAELRGDVHAAESEGGPLPM